MDETRVQDLTFRIVADMKSAYVVALACVGNQFGLFRTLAGAGWISSGELARRTLLDETHAREWAQAMVSAGYIEYDAESDRYSMSEEQAFVLASDAGPELALQPFGFITPSPFAPQRVTGFRHATPGGGERWTPPAGAAAPPVAAGFRRGKESP
jgi:hypothetical protein